MRFAQGMVLFVSSGGFVGYIPFAPGTLGSVVGIPICYVLSRFQPLISVVFAAMLIIVAIWMADKAERILDRTDPGCIVIDEIAGFAVTMLGLPFDFLTVASGFFVFRALDVLKPFPIRKLERNVKGGAGVVLDDVIAGIFSNLILRIGFLIASAFNG
ncbi:MAG: phosphatidylglycerophosphatase A [Deltaproteobacteria bacterium]|nr:phosphatidylglycerophosphatase A [Deltaproteobacteria bacterium]MBW1962818.1 phosphatidylglycerophosphatase A [Deltaproteobacteria bacterium]MBW1995218.1 phosphatidylglycerophosphatase A [Deltaproteobacteria bacterium]MBW2151595.1 phosphatidylglycerophosphatase A [Deltaproteobacteria bacterium]